MKPFFLTAVTLFFLPFFLKAQQFVEWNKNIKLNFNNFKQTPLQTKTPEGVLDLRMGWQIEQGNGIPKLFVRNRINQDGSWISMKNEDILNDMQLQFDLTELYSRKIRKEVEILQANNESNIDVYKARFMQGQKNFQKRLKKVQGTTLNQPDLYRILNKQIQDSLSIYNDYQKK